MVYGAPDERAAVAVPDVTVEWNENPATLNFVRDITEHKLSENRQKLAEQRSKAVIDNAPDGIVVINEILLILKD